MCWWWTTCPPTPPPGTLSMSLAMQAKSGRFPVTTRPAVHWLSTTGKAGVNTIGVCLAQCMPRASSSSCSPNAGATCPSYCWQTAIPWRTVVAGCLCVSQNTAATACIAPWHAQPPMRVLRLAHSVGAAATALSCQDDPSKATLRPRHTPTTTTPSLGPPSMQVHADFVGWGVMHCGFPGFLDSTVVHGVVFGGTSDARMVNPSCKCIGLCMRKHEGTLTLQAHCATADVSGFVMHQCLCCLHRHAYCCCCHCYKALPSPPHLAC